MNVMSYIIILQNFNIFFKWMYHNIKLFISIWIFSNAEVNIVVLQFWALILSVLLNKSIEVQSEGEKRYTLLKFFDEYG